MKRVQLFRKMKISRILIIFLAVLLGMMATIVVLIRQVNCSLYNERANTLSDTTVASAKTVNTAFAYDIKMETIFESIVSYDLPQSENIESFIEQSNKKLVLNNDMFFVVDSNGRYYSSDGQVGVLSDFSHYSGDSETTVTYLSTLPHLDPNETYLVVRSRLPQAVKATSDGAQIEILYSALMFNLDSLRETVNSLFAGDNNTFIYEKSNGTMLYKQFDLGVLIEGYNVYQKIMNVELPFDTSASLVEKCKNGETFVSEMTIEGKSYYLCSSALSVSDWNLLFVVSRDSIEAASQNGFTKIIGIVAGSVFLMFIGLLVMILLINNNREKAVEERAQKIINALSENFAAVFYVPFEVEKTNDIAYDCRLNETLAKYYPELYNIPSFTKRLDYLCEKLVVPEHREQFIAQTRREVILEKLNTEPYYNVTFKVNIENTEKYVQIQFSVIRNKTGIPEGMVAGYRDVDAETREKMAMSEALEKALQKANEASASKTAFLFNMSHDIRTPMNAIIGFTNMALRDIDKREKVLDCLKKIGKSGDILLSLINDILEMSRIESGKVTLNENRENIEDVFGKIEPIMNDLATGKNITLTYKVERLDDKLVLTDALRLQRVLLNLISNAVKYTNDGGRVEVKLRQLSEHRDGKGIYCFTVKDNGIGMSDEFQKHLFEEFSREETSATSGIQGTGLGLALVKSIVDLMHGEVTCKSELGVGSLFTVILPLQLQVDDIENDIGEYATDERNISLFGKKVLLVEDNELNREIATDILESEGITVYTAEDGIVAVDLMRKNGPDAYDFILMDVQMPQMNGYDASRAIHKLYPNDDITIIALSANAFEEDKEKSRAAGMKDHIAKPINIDELFRVIKKHL